MGRDRAVGSIRALFVILAVFLMLAVATQLVLAPILETLDGIVSGSTAAQNASFMDVDTKMTHLRLIGYIGAPVTILGLFIVWVLVWYVRKQATVR